MSHESQGRREVAEAVLIAALSALVSGLVEWGIASAKERSESSKSRTAGDKPDETATDRSGQKGGDVTVRKGKKKGGKK